MRIAAAEVALDSAASSSRYKEVRETLTEGFVRAGDTFNRQNLVAGTHRERVEREVVTEVRETQASYNDPRQVIAKQDLGKYSFDQLLGKRDSAGPSLFELSPEDKVKIELLKKLFESLTGKRFSVGMLDLQGSGGGGSGVQTSAQSSNAELNISSGGSAAEAGLEHGLVYNYSETHVSQSQVQFQATGQVKTADGRTIDLNLQLNMSRTLSENRSFQIRLGAALKDPLVINFAGKAAELSADTISFDLDSDGESEEIQRLQSSSGYIALDNNENGVIDNGSELFGANSGNGFLELAEYDEDKNGFIDEGDSVWEKLKIWVQHADGSSSLFSLADKGVGALYLGYTETEWDLQAGSGSDELGGKIRSSGLFLFENGNTGSLQQVDLVV
ncbi:hypothetical protein [Neptuniibacter halophilus]|uniref:hypothetical protein n=1 Tax=Neptuniibacter halophilus TaxID=651666 RepID=UPI0025735295|nr:hypothetical protein [Neptuniibacter halophilus]